ncbi:MAG: hypothetical protein AB7I27_17400 [Bacteriovoracaceae bacterium]
MENIHELFIEMTDTPIMNKQMSSISRENHLDHMVRVVPLLVLGYAIQGYVIWQMKGPEFTKDCLLMLGIGLVSMIAGFIIYDTQHKVHFFEDNLVIEFLGYKKNISYQDIASCVLDSDKNTFSKITLTTYQNKHFHFYFVDNGDKIKLWIDSKSKSQSLAA